MVTKEKERRKRKSEVIRKGGEGKKAMVALLVFTIAILEIVFGRKKLLDAKGLFGDNVITKLIAAYNNFREKESDLKARPSVLEQLKKTAIRY